MPKKFFIPAEKMQPLLGECGSALATDRIVVDGAGIGYCYREEPDNSLDSGWRFFKGDESPEYLEDSSHTGIYSLNTIANYEAAVLQIIDAPVGTAFEMGPKGTFVSVPFGGQ